MIDFAKLSAPFPASAVSWRSQSMTGDGTKAKALAYIDARDVMHRLDDVCGPENWQDTYAETPKGRLICTIAIRCGDDWVAKSDGAGDTDVEGEKGAISDSFKRAAVKWGVGRYLYDVDSPWAECESNERNGKRYFKKWTARGEAQLAAALNRVVPHVAPREGGARPTLITEQQLHALQDAANASQADIAAFCRQVGIKSLKEVPADKFAKALEMLSERKAA